MLGPVPDRERDVAAGRKHAGELAQRSLGAAEMEQEEVRDDGIEGRVLERERLGIAAAEHEVGMQPAGERDHRLGDVHADDRGAPGGGVDGHVARPRRDVEHPRAGADPGGVQQRRHDPARDRAEELVVAGGLLVPARRLERVERVRIFGHTGELGLARPSARSP